MSCCQLLSLVNGTAKYILLALYEPKNERSPRYSPTNGIGPERLPSPFQSGFFPSTRDFCPSASEPAIPQSAFDVTACVHMKISCACWGVTPHWLFSTAHL